MQSVYVDEFGSTLSREEIFKVLVLDPMEGAIDVDWRDFFPYLKWIPNKSLEKKIQQMDLNRQAVMNALIKEQKKRIDLGQASRLVVSSHLQLKMQISFKRIKTIIVL